MHFNHVLYNIPNYMFDHMFLAFFVRTNALNEEGGFNRQFPL
jgi:hypothetical protein